VEPYSQEHAYSDSVRVHQRIVDASRYVVGLSVEKDSTVQTVEQAQQRIVVASCIAVVGVVMPVLVVELVTLQSVAATHIVQLYTVRLMFLVWCKLRIRGVYSLGLRLWAI
jgi:hypothetical protein